MYRELQNISAVPTKERAQLRGLVEGMDHILAQGGIHGGMIHSFFYDCVDGQIVRSLMPRKSKESYHNKLSDFYIDSRVGFRGHRAVQEQMNMLESYFRGITKFRPRKYAVGDMVRIKGSTKGHPPSHAWIRDHPELWGKTAKVKKIFPRSINSLDYEGMEIQVGGKGSWFRVSSDDVTKAIKRSK